jgi:predicted Rossmann-fold nucleotide-binding protein
MREIETLDAFDAWAAEGASDVAAVQAIDLRSRTTTLCRIAPVGSLFLACPMDPLAAGQLVSQGAIVVPDMPGCFSVHRARLYAPEELFDVFDPDVDGSFAASFDSRVYAEYVAAGRDRPASMAVSFARSLHDHSITAALDELLEGRRVVAIMGGHGLERRDPKYRAVVRIAKRLAERAYLLVSGGGPGAMEATHLGAWLAGRPDEDVDRALSSGFTDRPAGAPDGKEYADPCWLARAWRLRRDFPRVRTEVISIGIPTWLYGHEPPTPLATHIAKYFANAIREEGLLAIARHGVVFAPGSAGTTQEIFQDACQNHYGTTGTCSPMLMFGADYWTNVRPVWPLLDAVSRDRTFGELVHLVDTVDDVVAHIEAYEPLWYVVSDDPDVALETRLRKTLRLRRNVFFAHHRQARTDDLTADVAAVAARAGAAGPAEHVDAAGIGSWLLEILSDDWVDPAALPSAVAQIDADRALRIGAVVVLVRADTVSAWSVRLDD